MSSLIGFGPQLRLIGGVWLFSMTVLLLVTGRRATSQEYLGLSGTFWITSLTVVVAGAILLSIVADAEMRQNLLGPGWRRLVLALTLGLTVLLGAHLAVNPILDGFQMLAALWAFVSSLLAFSIIGENSVGAPLRLVTAGLLVCATVTILFFLALGFEFGFENRARGQVLAIAAAAVPLYIRQLGPGIAAFSIFAVTAVLSDSRFAVATLAVSSVFVFLALWHERRFGLRVTGALLFGMLVSVGLATFQRMGGFRPSFQLPLSEAMSSPATLEQGSVEQGSVEQGSVEQGSVEQDFSEINAWSQGRGYLWRLLLREMNDATAWIIGKGTGFASLTSQSQMGIAHPHNEYIRLLVDGGLVGLLLLLTLGTALLVTMIRFRTTLGPRNFWAGLALLLTLASHSLVTNTLINPHFLVPTAVLLGLALSRANTLPVSQVK